MFEVAKKPTSMVWRGYTIEKGEPILFIPKNEGYNREEISNEFIKAAKDAGVIKSKKPALAKYWDNPVVVREMYEHDLLGMIKSRVAIFAEIALIAKQHDLEWAKDIIQKSAARLIEKNNHLILLPTENKEIQEQEILLFKGLFPNAQIIEI